MPELELNAVNGLRAWAYLLMNNQDSWDIPEAQAQLSFYGQDDSAYLVIDIHTSNTSSTQYTFIAENDSDKPNTIRHIFTLLRTINFNLTTLLNWLHNASWTDNGMGDHISSHGLTIYRDIVHAVE